MPFKSKAQRRKFAELLVKGEISPETYEEWNRSTGGKELPERVQKKKKKKKTVRRRKATTAARKSAKAARKGTKAKPRSRARQPRRRKPV
jgi:hypothetical protein